jgi:hypothetical protein
VARLCIKAIKAVIKGSVFRSSITSAIFISSSCNHVPRIIAGQYPCPSGMSWQVMLVGMTAKVKRAVIAVIIELFSRAAVVFDWSEFVFHWTPQESSI